MDVVYVTYMSRIFQQFRSPPWEIVFKILRFHGFWFSHHWDNKLIVIYMCYTFSVVSFIIMDFFSQLLFLVIQKNDVKIILGSCLTFLPALNSIVKAWTLIWKRNELDSIYKNVCHDLRDTKNIYTRKIHQQCNNTFRIIMWLHIICYTVITFSMLFTAVIRNSYAENLWIPKNINDNCPFGILFMVFAISYWYGIVALLGHDIFYCGILIEIIGHIENLKRHLKITPMRRNQRKRRHLYNCLMYHQFIYKVTEDFQKTFFISNTGDLYTITATLCAALLQLMTANLFTVDFFLFTTTIVGMIIGSFYRFWIPNEVMLRSIQVSFAAYDMKWTDKIGKSTSKDILIIMKRSSMRPIIFTAGVLATPMTNETFHKIIGTLYTAFALIRKLSYTRDN